tara:strand:+ start:3894 stop:4151 length:258 start_codon:yes stop_codon:yes gene_type:complete
MSARRLIAADIIIGNLFTETVIAWAIRILGTEDRTSIVIFEILVFSQSAGDAPTRANGALGTLYPVTATTRTTATALTTTALLVF